MTAPRKSCAGSQQPEVPGDDFDDLLLKHVRSVDRHLRSFPPLPSHDPPPSPEHLQHLVAKVAAAGTPIAFAKRCVPGLDPATARLATEYSAARDERIKRLIADDHVLGRVYVQGGEELALLQEMRTQRDIAIGVVKGRFQSFWKSRLRSGREHRQTLSADAEQAVENALLDAPIEDEQLLPREVLKRTRHLYRQHRRYVRPLFERQFRGAYVAELDTLPPPRDEDARDALSGIIEREHVNARLASVAEALGDDFGIVLTHAHEGCTWPEAAERHGHRATKGEAVRKKMERLQKKMTA